MQDPTAEPPGSAVSDAVSIGLWLWDVDRVRVVSHGGDTIGQHWTREMVPEHDIAIGGPTNSGPSGSQLLDDQRRWALEAHLGVSECDPNRSLRIPASSSQAGEPTRRSP